MGNLCIPDSLIVIDIMCISLAFSLFYMSSRCLTLIDEGVGPKRPAFSELLQSQRCIREKF